jgi:hypothetical protein
MTIQGARADQTFIDAGGSGPVLLISSGTVNLVGLTIQNGLSSVEGGGLFATGGISIGIATVTIERCTIRNNRFSTVFGGGGATVAGGILNNGGTVTISNNTISSNSVDGNFGGVTTAVGGILNAAGAFGTVTISNSTISSNSIDGNFGGGGPSLAGGILNGSGTLTISNSTISSNSVDGNFGGGPSLAGGILNASAGTAQLKNTIVADNLVVENQGGNCFGAVASQGHNLDDDNMCSLTALTDLPNTDPLLGPLQNNGGPTFTHALLPDSPAIDAGGACMPPETDQRGVSRLGRGLRYRGV